MCSTGAAGGPPSYASAVRSPEPVIMIVIAFPGDHSERSTISWMISFRSGVRWASPRVPTLVHETGDQRTEANVVGR